MLMTRAAILFIFILVGSAMADAPQYCAHYYDGGRACGIPTLESCLQSVGGVGGECEIDNTADIPHNLMQQLLQSRSDTPPAVRDLDAMPPPPQ